MPRLRNGRMIIWTFTGLKKEFVKALELLNRGRTTDKLTAAKLFEPVMQRTIDKANKIKNNSRYTTD
jgi:hypothetical protein